MFSLSDPPSHPPISYHLSTNDAWKKNTKYQGCWCGRPGSLAAEGSVSPHPATVSVRTCEVGGRYIPPFSPSGVDGRLRGGTSYQSALRGGVMNLSVGFLVNPVNWQSGPKVQQKTIGIRYIFTIFWRASLFQNFDLASCDKIALQTQRHITQFVPKLETKLYSMLRPTKILPPYHFASPSQTCYSR